MMVGPATPAFRNTVTQPAEVELVVLLDESGQAIGSMSKADVHTRHTPLHRAFSCYLVDDEGKLLMTRRALTKATWPGVWTNSFCGHPLPGEDTETAIVRRSHQELGAEIDSIRLVDPDFRYRAVDASGIVENEVCPVYVARLVGPLDPSVVEVCQWAWARIVDVVRSLESTPFLFSPWMVDQHAAGVFERLRQ